MKGNPVFYKTLVVWVIVLFIGVGIQPAIAIINNGNNNPPEAPDIAGPVRGKPNIEYEYVFSTTDPEGEVVSYYIEWGDGTSTGWTDYYSSGEEVAISHTWDKIDWDNTIRAKAKDVNGAESDWSESQVPISKDDCDICPKVSKQHFVRIKGLIDRLYTLNTKLSKVSKLKPELEEKYQEVSVIITELQGLDLLADFCDLLWDFGNQIGDMFSYFFNEKLRPVRAMILFVITFLLYGIWMSNCYEH